MIGHRFTSTLALACGLLLGGPLPALADHPDTELRAHPPAHTSMRITHELVPEVAFYFSDALRSTNLFGGSYTLRAFDHLWIGIQGLVGSAKADEPNGLGIEIDDTVVVASVPGDVELPHRPGSRRRLLDRPISTARWGPRGSGWTTRSPSGPFVGGGMIAHTPLDWLALRADVKNHFVSPGRRSGQGHQRRPPHGSRPRDHLLTAHPPATIPPRPSTRRSCP